MTERDVQGALSDALYRATQDVGQIRTWAHDKYTSRVLLIEEYVLAADDRATLAKEVERLHRQVGTLAANQSETGFGGLPIVESDAVPDREIRLVAVNDDGQMEVVAVITDIDDPAETREDVT